MVTELSLAKSYLSICPNTYDFLRFFLIFEIFFFSFEKTIKSHEILTVFAERLRTTLNKFLDNRSKRFANTTQTFFDKRGF